MHTIGYRLFPNKKKKVKISSEMTTRNMTREELIEITGNEKDVRTFKIICETVNSDVKEVYEISVDINVATQDYSKIVHREANKLAKLHKKQFNYNIVNQYYNTNNELIHEVIYKNKLTKSYRK